MAAAIDRREWHRDAGGPPVRFNGQLRRGGQRRLRAGGCIRHVIHHPRCQHQAGRAGHRAGGGGWPGCRCAGSAEPAAGVDPEKFGFAGGSGARARAGVRYHGVALEKRHQVSRNRFPPVGSGRECGQHGAGARPSDHGRGTGPERAPGQGNLAGASRRERRAGDREMGAAPGRRRAKIQQTDRHGGALRAYGRGVQDRLAARQRVGRRGGADRNCAGCRAIAAPVAVIGSGRGWTGHPVAGLGETGKIQRRPAPVRNAGQPTGGGRTGVTGSGPDRRRQDHHAR